MLGLSVGEVLVVACVAIVFIGPEKLPGAMANLGRIYRSLVDSMEGIKNAMFYKEPDTMTSGISVVNESKDAKEEEEARHTVAIDKKADLDKAESNKPIVNESGAS